MEKESSLTDKIKESMQTFDDRYEDFNTKVSCVEYGVYSSLMPHHLIQTGSGLGCPQRKILDKPANNQQDIVTVLDNLVKLDHSSLLLKFLMTEDLISQISQNMGIESPTLRIKKAPFSFTYKVMGKVDQEYGCPHLEIFNNKSINPTKKFFGLNVWELYDIAHHELTHAKQAAYSQQYYNGDESVEDKYKLMFLGDIFAKGIEFAQDSSDEIKWDEKGKKALNELKKKTSKQAYENYMLNPFEVDARLMTAKALLDIKKQIQNNPQLLKLYEKQAPKVLEGADIDTDTGTKMLKNLEKQKNIYEKLYGNTELGKLIVDHYEELVKSKGIKQYADSINNFGSELQTIYDENNKSSLKNKIASVFEKQKAM